MPKVESRLMVFARTISQALLWLLAAAICMFALDQLARQRLRAQLDGVASERLGMRLHSMSPHRWSGTVPTDVVAQRAFSAPTFEFRDDGLHFRVGPNPAAVGLVISGNIDLLSHSTLTIDIASSNPSRVSLLVRESLDGPVCTSESRPVPAGPSEIEFAIPRVKWRCVNPARSAPQQAAMLRMQFEGPANTGFVFRSAQLNSRSTLAVADLARHAAPLLPAPGDEPAFERELQRLVADPARPHPTLLQMPLDARVEQVLVARDRILEAMPETIIIPKGDLAGVSERAVAWTSRSPSASWPRWLGVTLLAAALMLLRLRPPFNARLRAALELAGVMGAPLALILGNQIGDNLSPPLLAVAAITFVFALSLLFGTAPALPGSRMLVRGWSVALLSIAIASSVSLLLGGGITHFDWPTLAEGARYLAWATVQQFLICVIVAGRIEILCRNRSSAILGAAALFALLHAPNAMLMQLTFVGGLIWIWNWQSHRALLANIVAHALCGILLTLSLPPHWLYSAEVSVRYFLIGPS